MKLSRGAGAKRQGVGKIRYRAGAGRGGPAAALAVLALCACALASCVRGSASQAVPDRTAAPGSRVAPAPQQPAHAPQESAFRGPTFSTWEKEGKAVDPRFRFPAPAQTPGSGFVPWTGTVSHHFLTDPLIDAWFREIKARREVRHFFILSPSHFGLSTRDYSVADGRWECASGCYVYTSRELSARVCTALGVDYDNAVFPDEHGVSTLMPYIYRYFPNADVVAVAIDGEPPVHIDYCERLYEAIAPFFDEAGKKEDFLIVSSDFSHHGTPEQTAYKDGISESFFANPVQKNFIAAVCDNRPSIYVMTSLFGPDVQTCVLFHTNSFEISGMDGEDITSYFFSLFG